MCLTTQSHQKLWHSNSIAFLPVAHAPLYEFFLLIQGSKGCFAPLLLTFCFSPPLSLLDFFGVWFTVFHCMWDFRTIFSFLFFLLHYHCLYSFSFLVFRVIWSTCFQFAASLSNSSWEHWIILMSQSSLCIHPIPLSPHLSLYLSVCLSFLDRASLSLCSTGSPRTCSAAPRQQWFPHSSACWGLNWKDTPPCPTN